MSYDPVIPRLGIYPREKTRDLSIVSSQQQSDKPRSELKYPWKVGEHHVVNPCARKLLNNKKEGTRDTPNSIDRSQNS